MYQEEPKLSVEQQEKLNIALYQAAGKGDVGKIASLILQGAKPNRNFSENNLTISASPLLNAVWSNRLDAVKQLLACGASVDFPVGDNFTALMYASGKSINIEILKVLITAGANVNAKNARGYTPLNMAQVRGNKEAEKLLIEAGAKE